MINILLTFTGFHDPYSFGLLGEEQQQGPILSLIKERPFDQIYLFSTPNTEKNTTDTRNILQSLYPGLKISVVELLLDDPTNYSSILKGLRENLKTICNAMDSANYYVSITSGTPQMHACWVLLVASGEIPARILNVRPPRFVTKEKPLVEEVNITSSEFPIIRPNIAISDVSEISHPDLCLNRQIMTVWL